MCNTTGTTMPAADGLHVILTAVKAEVISKILHVNVSASYSSVLVSRQMLFDEAVV